MADEPQPALGTCITSDSTGESDARDQRTHARRPVVRPARVLHGPSRKYAWAETVNLSPGGALLRVESSRPLSPGDLVHVGIAWTSDPVLKRREMLTARVTRVARAPGPGQAVAVEFAETVQLAAVA